MRRLWALAVPLLVAAACVGGADEAPAPADPPEAAQAPTTEEPTAEGGPRDEPTAEPGPGEGDGDGDGDPHGELACADDILAQIDETIDAQLAAFAEDDFGTALGLASEGFQEGLDEDTFRQIIEQDYPVVANAVGHRSGVCVEQDGSAQLLVTVQGEDGTAQELVYTMALEDDGWRIEGAQNPPGGPSAPPLI